MASNNPNNTTSPTGNNASKNNNISSPSTGTGNNNTNQSQKPVTTLLTSPTVVGPPPITGNDPRRPIIPNPTPINRGFPKADTDLSWGTPAGLPLRRSNDENLVIFRRAVGINSALAGAADPSSMEEGRRKAVGMYGAVLAEQRKKWFWHALISAMIYVSHFAQVVIGATLTAL